MILIVLGLVFLIAGTGMFLPASIVSVSSPIMSVKAEGVSPTQAGSLFVGVVLLIAGIYLHGKGK